MTPIEKIQALYLRLNILLADAVRTDTDIIKTLNELSDLRAMLERGEDAERD